MPKAFTAQFVQHQHHTHDSSSPAFYRPDAHVHVHVSSSRPGSTSPTGNRAVPLQRGEACLNCRRRKMKCDAGKPSCSSCTRAGKADACEYEETRFLATIAALEEQVRALKARIRELEGDGDDAGLPLPSSGFTAFLPSPTLSDDTLSPLSAHSPTLQYEPPAPALLPISQPSEQWSPYSPDELDFPTNLQPTIIQHLISLFVPHAYEFGLPAASIPLLGRHSALTFAACAAASTLSTLPSATFPPEPELDLEREFILRTDAALARSASHPSTFDVQASSLLSQLAFARGREMEAQRFLGSAMRVARALRVDEGTWGMVLRAERIGLAAVQAQRPVLAEQAGQAQAYDHDGALLFEKQPMTWGTQDASGYGFDYGAQ